MAERPLKDRVWDSSGQITSTGSANAYVITIAEQVNGYFQGMAPIRFKANFSNTGSATANICTQTAPSGLGAVTLKKGGGASNLASGDIVSGGVYTLIYDGSFFQVLELNGTVPAGSVGTTQLADDAVTNAKLANMAQQTIKARKTLSTGDPEDCTLSEVLDFIGSAAQGDILYRGASAWARLPAGTAGQVLTTAGAGANPAWGNAGMVLLTSGTVSAAATLDLVLTSFTGYRGFKFWLDFLPATDGAAIICRFSTDGGSSYDATGCSYVEQFSVDTPTSGTGGSGSTTGITMSGAVGNATEEGVYVEATLLNPASTARNSRIFGHAVKRDSNATPLTAQSLFAGAREAAQDTDAIRFLFSSGNIAAGNYAVYGIS